MMNFAQYVTKLILKTMEQLFNDLRQQIAGTMGDTVSLIDEDYGQLDALKNGGEQYPVTFPCILLSPLETVWSNQKDNRQHGHCTLSVRLAFDCHSDAPQAQHASERMQAADRLNACLRGWQFDGCSSALTRRTSKLYALPGEIKVYETEYSTSVDEPYSE